MGLWIPDVGLRDLVIELTKLMLRWKWRRKKSQIEKKNKHRLRHRKRHGASRRRGVPRRSVSKPLRGAAGVLTATASIVESMHGSELYSFVPSGVRNQGSVSYGTVITSENIIHS